MQCDKVKRRNPSKMKWGSKWKQVGKKVWSPVLTFSSSNLPTKFLLPVSQEWQMKIYNKKPTFLLDLLIACLMLIPIFTKQRNSTSASQSLISFTTCNSNAAAACPTHRNVIIIIVILIYYYIWYYIIVILVWFVDF